MGARQTGARLLWFVGLWVVGVGTITVIGYLIRLALLGP